MGLAGRKEKQRIPNDPRNLSWADDANKFGAAYLQKLGWSAGTGLGTQGDGRTTHIKVQQKLDMMGIGAAHQKDPNGLAWKQNRDFENLLRRLNAGGDAEEEKGTKVDGFARAKEGDKDEVEEEKDGKKDKKDKKNKKDKKKRKRHEKEDEGKMEVDEESEKKKDKKRRKKEKKERKEAESESEDEESSPAPSTSAPRPPLPVRAHRARFLASKRLASKSSTAIDEILGISRSASTTPFPTSRADSPPESASPTPAPENASEEELKLQELTTSSKSVMDYFREKLAAKSNSTSSSASPSGSATPAAQREEDAYDDYDDRPRGLGLGFARGGLGASKLRQEVAFEAEVEETSTSRMGLGAFSRMSSMFAAAKETTKTTEMSEVVVEKMEVDVVEEVVASEKKEKNKKDKGKGKEKEVVGEETGEVEVEVKKGKKSKKEKRAEADADVSEDTPVQDVTSEKPSRKEKKKKLKTADVVTTEESSSKKKKKSKKDKSSTDSDS